MLLRIFRGVSKTEWREKSRVIESVLNRILCCILLCFCSVSGVTEAYSVTSNLVPFRALCNTVLK